MNEESIRYFCKLSNLTLKRDKRDNPTSEYFLTAVYHLTRPDGYESEITIPHITLPVADHFNLIRFAGGRAIDIGFGKLPMEKATVDGRKDVYAAEKIVCKSMTKAEIEKELGYKIQIVEE